ncbi:MAG TPA: triose-phosphate isomerase [Myxococcota bacterium]|nr:triose-phosphate isomerase [Myxococcota bacterium]HOD06529.1 triose-phosphate isomerase [Myxococcota bacterium]HPB50550.1 triose-phosphate isomerase [Myxococcota bacterium]HQP95653.1 triose-phosphate isomerase [Myxococcota bacterium]
MSTRKYLVAGNWKMNLDVRTAADLARGVVSRAARFRGVDVVVCPSAVLIPGVARVLEGSNVALGGQDLSVEEAGAFTGETSAAQLLSTGCRYVIVGHSERREYHFESDELVGAKVKRALGSGLIPIFCVGEKLAERKAGKTFERIERQVRVGLDGLDSTAMANVVVAYEPVWAIGTGEVATPAQAEEVHEFIRGILKGMFGAEVAGATRILYGGSVKADNARDLMACPDVDGALVGGASLKAEQFGGIIEATGV